MNTGEEMLQDQSRLKLDSFNSARNLHFDRFLHLDYFKSPSLFWPGVTHTKKVKL